MTEQAFNPTPPYGISGVDPAADEAARREFRKTLGQFATGVTVMTTLGQSAERVGMTVNSFNSLSLEPPLVLWSIAKTTPAFACFQMQDAFAVNVLSAEQEALARQMAQSGSHKFDGVDVRAGLGGVPLIEGCVVHLECNVWARYPGGDHDIIVGRVKQIFNTGKPPLLFHNGDFRSF